VYFCYGLLVECISTKVESLLATAISKIIIGKFRLSLVGRHNVFISFMLHALEDRIVLEKAKTGSNKLSPSMFN